MTEVVGTAAGRGVARNTAIFSFLTGFSRVVGLLREIVFASYFGTTGPASERSGGYQRRQARDIKRR